MNIKKSSHWKTAVLFLVSALLLLCSNLVYAADRCQTIFIQEGKGAGGTRLEIFPEKVTVPVGTCTVWINWVTDRQVRVSFRENAKQCMLSTESSTGFEEKELKPGQSCYISDALQLGKTASLYWTKPGVFKYTLEAHGTTTVGAYSGDILAEGVIEIK